MPSGSCLRTERVESSSGTGRDSEWARHTAGDEIVMVIDGETTIYF